MPLMRPRSGVRHCKFGALAARQDDAGCLGKPLAPQRHQRGARGGRGTGARGPAAAQWFGIICHWGDYKTGLRRIAMRFLVHTLHL